MLGNWKETRQDQLRITQRKTEGGGGGGGIKTSFGAFKILSRAGVMSRNEEEGEEELLV